MSLKDEPVFVLAWVTTRSEKELQLGNGGRVLFVEHPERGWEIPGGHVEFEENPDDAMWHIHGQEVWAEVANKYSFTD